jgi:tetratricopeptide (TPR) repeat protein
MTSPELLSAFTPSTMHPTTLEAIFVKREPLVQRILGSITAAARGEGIEHHIAVGPRGIGKTHLLSLITYRLLQDPMFLDRAVVAWLREEEWGISSVGELYEAIIKQLASEDTPILAVHTAATAAVAQLAGASFEELADEAEHLLTKVLDDRKAVVVVENLDLLFATIGKDDQHRLRAYLQNEQNLVLLASTPSLSESISLRKGLFFGFFAIHWLDELTLDEARDLLGRIAELRNDEEGRKLTAYLETDEATRRLQTVQALAGGHPRLWVLMAECITTERLEEVVGLLLAVLDDLTPYYQSQMAALSPQQRKIVMVLSRAEGAIPPRDIAARARIQEKVAAKQLGDLAKLGYVRVAQLPDGVKVKDKRIRPYELREPLLRHVLEVKESRGRPLALIVEFLRAWYDRPRLEAWASSTSPLSAAYANAALFVAHAKQIEPDQFEGSLAILKRADQVLARNEADLTALTDRGFALGALGRHDEALVTFERALQSHPGHALTHFNRGVALEKLGRKDDALVSYERAIEIAPTSPEAIGNRGGLLNRMGRLDEALEALDTASSLSPDSPVIASHRGTVLAKLDRPAQALDELDRALHLGVTDPDIRHNRGVVLLRLGHKDAARQAFDEIADGDPPHAGACWNLIALDITEAHRTISVDTFVRAITATTSESDLQRSFLWVTDAIADNLPQYEREVALDSLAAASTTGDVLVDLLAALAVDLEAHPSRGADLGWLQAINQALDTRAPESAITAMFHAIAGYQTSQDSAPLLKLPHEVRIMAYAILGMDDLA